MVTILNGVLCTSVLVLPSAIVVCVLSFLCDSDWLSKMISFGGGQAACIGFSVTARAARSLSSEPVKKVSKPVKKVSKPVKKDSNSVAKKVNLQAASKFAKDILVAKIIDKNVDGKKQASPSVKLVKKDIPAFVLAKALAKNGQSSPVQPVSVKSPGRGIQAVTQKAAKKPKTDQMAATAVHVDGKRKAGGVVGRPLRGALLQ